MTIESYRSDIFLHEESPVLVYRYYKNNNSGLGLPTMQFPQATLH